MSGPYKKRVELIAAELNGRVLDAGCCAGPMHTLLKKLRPDCAFSGIDLNIQAEYANDKEIVEGDAQTMTPFKDGTFDVVVAGELIEHLPKPEDFIKASHRVLKTGGKIVITTNNKSSLVNRLFHTYEHERTTHVHIFTKKELTDLLAGSGFAVEKIKMLPYVSSRFPASDALRILLNSVLPDSLRENFFLVARKA